MSNKEAAMLEVTDLVQVYQDGPATITALSLPHFSAEKGSAWCVTGPSGSGKSTLLHCISGLIRPTKGTITWNGKAITGVKDEKELDDWRASCIGYVFQKFNLLPFLSARENILTGAWFAGVDKGEALSRLKSLSGQMGIADLLSQYPEALSQGEQQRVAIARALIKKPPLILADEPTANLDADNSQIVINLLKNYVAQNNAMLLIASHDPMVIGAFEQRLPLSKGGRHDHETRV
jgi:ABC-type lipoprotein export system ATPase subunit